MTTAPTICEVELSAWLDGESPPDRRGAVDRWVRSTPEAAARIDVWRRQNDLIRARFARVATEALPDSIWPAPNDTQRREAPKGVSIVRASDAPIKVERFDRLRRDQRARLALVTLGSFVAGSAAALVAVAALGYAPALMTGVRVIAARPVEATLLASPMQALASRAIDAHRTYVRDARRPVEVDVGDPKLLVDFLSRRIGLSVTIPTFDVGGPRLLGGRVTPGDIGPAGLLVFEEPGGDRYGLFLTRTPSLEKSALQIIERRNSAVAAWMERGVGYVLTGPNDPVRLRRLAEAIDAQNPPIASAPR
jgi:anti-sigma factor RsiW